MNIEVIIIEGIFALVAGILAGAAVVCVFNLMPGKWFCDYGETPVERGDAVAQARNLTAKDAENITRSLVDPEFKRIKENPWRWVYGAGFACLCVRILMRIGLQDAGTGLPGDQADGQVIGIQFALAALVCCWVLLLVGLSDMKYMIIPDQLLPMLAIGGVGLLPVNLAIVKSGKPEILRGLSERVLSKFELSDNGVTAVYDLSGVLIGVLLMLLVAGLGRLLTAGQQEGAAAEVAAPEGVAVSDLALQGASSEVSGRRAPQSALGGGDIKLYAVLGFCLGGIGIVFVFLLSSLTAGIDAGLAIAQGRAGRKSARPLGPHICGAAMIYIFAIWPLML